MKLHFCKRIKLLSKYQDNVVNKKGKSASNNLIQCTQIAKVYQLIYLTAKLQRNSENHCQMKFTKRTQRNFF